MSEANHLGERFSGVGRPIAAFVYSRVAGNLLMVLALAGGLLAAWNVPLKASAEFDSRQVVVTVPYPGSSPAEVEESITRRIEERVIGIDGVRRVTSRASSEVGTVVLDVAPLANTGDVLAEVRSAVDRIERFPPSGAEPPEVAIPTFQTQAVTVAVASAELEALGGCAVERRWLLAEAVSDSEPVGQQFAPANCRRARQGALALRRAAEQVREDLLALPSVSTVALDWAPAREIAIDVSEEALREYDLSVADVANTLSRSSVELTSGQLLTNAGGLVVRLDDRRTRAEEFEDIVLVAQSSGARVRLGDVAEVREALGEPAGVTKLDGVPAVFISVLTSAAGGSEFGIAREVDAMLAGYAAPAGTEVSVWIDHSRNAATRLNVVRNTGVLALALVFVVLVLVFDFRLAMWVAVGLPVSFLGALALFPAFDLTINFATLYAMVIMIGVLVDDAVVVGESVASQRELGMEGAEAAIVGARQVFWPVAVGVATTFLAFVPFLFAYGVIGQLLGVFPVVVGLVLAASLVEAFLILPSHLSHGGAWSRWPLEPVQASVRERLDRLRDRVAVPAIAAATRRPATTLAAAALVLVGCAALFLGGVVRYGDLATTAPDGTIDARLTYPVGTPIDAVHEGARQVEAAAKRTGEQLGRSPIASVVTVVGHHEPREALGPGRSGSHLAKVVVALRDESERSVSAAEVERAWRRNVGTVVGAEALTITSAELFLSSRDVAVALVHPDEGVLAHAVRDLAAAMRSLPGTFGVSDSQVPGRRHFDLQLTPAGQAAGLTTAALGEQLRARFFGAEVQRIQRGREEIKVMVRYPEEERRSFAELADERIELPSGGEMPLALAATAVESRSFETLMRLDGVPAVEVGASVDSAVATANQIRSLIAEDVLPGLLDRHPGLTVGWITTGTDDGQPLQTLAITLPIVLLVMYLLMAVQFRSYLQPFIILTAMPLAAGGAIFAHFVFGYDFSIASMFGVVAVLGVVINDTLLLMDRYNSLRSPTLPAIAAIGGAVRQRFRPIFLTTVTTVVGLLPVLYLKSESTVGFTQLVVSITGGLVAGSAGILFVVPAIVLIAEGIRERTGRVAAAAT